jgi:plasmid maintenance system antidote protein VapI
MTPHRKTYAELVRAALQNPRDRKSMRQVGREIGFSYEHVRKIVAGEVTFTRAFSDALSQNLGLDPDSMWQLAQTEKLKKRFHGAELPVEFPKDTRVKEIWNGLNDVQRDAWIKIGEGWAQANEYVKRGEEAVTAATAGTASRPGRR